MSSLAGPFEGVDRQGHVFLIVRLGDLGKVPLCAYWTSRKNVSSPLLGDGWCLPLLEGRLVPSVESEVQFFQPDGFMRTLTRGRKDPRNLSSGVWRGREEEEGNALLSADFGAECGKVSIAFHGGRMVTLRCAEGSFGFSYKGREIGQVTLDGTTVLKVVRSSREPNRIEFKLAGGQASAVCEKRSDGLALVAADGTRHDFSFGGEQWSPTLTADGVVYRWGRSRGKVRSIGDWTYQVGDPEPEWNNVRIERKRKDGQKELYWFNLANGKGEYCTADGERYVWARFPSGDFYGLMRWSEKTRGKQLLHRHDYTYDECRRMVFHRLRRGADERTGGLPELDETWYAPDGKVRRRRVDGKDVKL